MPLVNVKLIEGVFDAAQKREIVEKLTEAMVSIEGENMRPVTVCYVEEVRSGDYGIGASPLPPPTSRTWLPANLRRCSAKPVGQCGATREAGASGAARRDAASQAMTLNIERNSSIERNRDR